MSSEYVYKYSNRYNGIKSEMHRLIYDTFCSKKMYDDYWVKEPKLVDLDPENILSKEHMIYTYIDHYLYDCKNVNDLILNYRSILINIMSCMFTLNLRMRVIHGFFDSVVDYIIEKDCYSKFGNIDDLIMIFTYISPEKLYDYIYYMYKCEVEGKNKKYINDTICSKIYMTILYNSPIVTMVQYGYANIENVGEIVYKYYLLIKKLEKEDILVTYDEKVVNTSYDLVQSSRSEDILYIKLLTNIMNEMNIHLKK